VQTPVFSIIDTNCGMLFYLHGVTVSLRAFTDVRTLAYVAAAAVAAKAAATA
jgi:hypothetical protein